MAKSEYLEIDMTPTWVEAIGIFKVLLSETLGTVETKKTAWEEIGRMALAADQRNDMAKLLAEIMTMNPRTVKLMQAKAKKALIAAGVKIK